MVGGSGVAENLEAVAGASRKRAVDQNVFAFECEGLDCRVLEAAPPVLKWEGVAESKLVGSGNRGSGLAPGDPLN